MGSCCSCEAPPAGSRPAESSGTSEFSAVAVPPAHAALAPSSAAAGAPPQRAAARASRRSRPEPAGNREAARPSLRSVARALKGALEWTAPGATAISEPLTAWPVGVVLDLPETATGAVVGRGGSVVKSLQSKYGVCVQIDGPDKHGSASDRGTDRGRCVVTITGGSCTFSDVGAAAEALVRAFREAAACRASVLLSRPDGPHTAGPGGSHRGITAALALVRSAGALRAGGPTGPLCLTAAKLVSFKAEGPLAALADAAALELAADSSATLALALDALRAAAAEPAALGAGSSAASSAAAAGAAAGSAGLAGAGWVVAAATLPSREVGRLVGRGGETVKRISEAVDGVLVADALRESRAGKKAAAPDHTACVVACPAAKLDVAAQEVGRAASNAATLSRTLLPDAAVSAARKDLHAAEAAAAASPAPSDGAAAAGAAGASPAEDADSAAVFFRPEGVAGHNGAAGLSAVLEPVARATKSVDVAVYGLTDDVVRNALMAAHQRGVAVRVIVDKEQAEEPGADAKWLAEQGVQVAEAPGSEDGRLFHHKVILADAAVMVTGSLNLTKHASHANWENMVVSAEPAAVASFQAEFNRLWALCGPQASAADRGASLLAGPPSADSPLVQAAAGSGGAAAGGGAFAAGRTESIFFPCGEEGLKRLCKYMASAKTSLDVAALALTSDRVREAVQARHAAGVQVRVLADRSKSTEPGSDLAWLGKQSVPVRCARPTGDESSLFHHKVSRSRQMGNDAGAEGASLCAVSKRCADARVSCDLLRTFGTLQPNPSRITGASYDTIASPFFVVDDHTVVTGSFNLTASAAERNFESVVVMASKGAAARFTAEFDTLWDAAVQL
ncbi:unnamed protein product [Symbiodinium sp. KB8]|nr:unnamed protein product [Symbiodinium sp. KB8]